MPHLAGILQLAWKELQVSALSASGHFEQTPSSLRPCLRDGTPPPSTPGRVTTGSSSAIMPQCCPSKDRQLHRQRMPRPAALPRPPSTYSVKTLPVLIVERSPPSSNSRHATPFDGRLLHQLFVQRDRPHTEAAKTPDTLQRTSLSIRRYSAAVCVGSDTIRRKVERAPARPGLPNTATARSSISAPPARPLSVSSCSRICSLPSQVPRDRQTRLHRRE